MPRFVKSLFLAAVLLQLAQGKSFNRVATFPVCKQLQATCNIDDETVAEEVSGE